MVFPAMLWLGVLIGVSFLATPVKFQAPSLDLPTALDVGRVTFALLSKAEWVLWLLLAGVALLTRARATGWTVVALLGIILAAQTFWLLPVLDERIGRIIAGKALSGTNHHLFYVLAEGLKALVLILLSVAAFVKAPRPGR